MIAYLEGKIIAKGQNEAVISVNGIGFQVNCSVNTLTVLPKRDESCVLWTWLSVRQDGVDLFGFASQEERRMFLRLTAVSGIGPKTALQILGCMPLKDLTLAIMTGDTAVLSRAPGIGKKTAQRIALELKEKVTEADLESLHLEGAVPAAQLPQTDAVNEAVQALMALGYTSSESARAVSGVSSQSDDTGELIKLALRDMAGR